MKERTFTISCDNMATLILVNIKLIDMLFCIFETEKQGLVMEALPVVYLYFYLSS